jgi:hypothetical protein
LLDPPLKETGLRKPFVQNVEKEDFNPTYKIDIQKIDTAEAVAGQSDEEFAQSLQEAEFIKAGLKPR